MLNDIVRTSHLFSELDETLVSAIASSAIIKTYAREELVFYEGDSAHSFYVVVSGKVKVYKMSPDGKEQILMIAAPGDSFAEAAMFMGGNFPASAESMEQTEIMVIERLKFLALLKQNPDLAMNLIGRLAELLRKLTNLVEGLSLTDVTSRLAHYILERVLESEKDGKKENVLVLEEKKSILASQLGTIPETLSRSFARLTKENVIKVQGSRIEILDIGRLEQIAG